jgi:hypothetical protein
VWLRQHEVKEETVLFQELPHALRNEVAWQACRAKLRGLPLLRELPERTLYLLASRMTPFRWALQCVCGGGKDTWGGGGDTWNRGNGVAVAAVIWVGDPAWLCAYC